MEGYTHEEQVEISRAIMRLLDGWGVPAEAAISILGLPSNTRKRQVQKFKGDTPLPSTPDVMERVTHLTAIASALRTTYPTNPQMGNIWMGTPHRRFGGRAPLATIVEKGVKGLREVRAHLDCTYTWD